MSARDDYPALADVTDRWWGFGQLQLALHEIDQLRAGKCQTLAECIQCCIRVDQEAETDRFMDAIGANDQPKP